MRVAEVVASVPELSHHEVRRLLQLAMDAPVTALVANPEVPDAALARFREFVARRLSGEPLQYLEGSVSFGPITLRADSRALIPRPETERMWELALELIAYADSPLIVDLCSGSGNLALALKATIADATVVGTDISAEAVALAGENAAALDLPVDFLVGDLFASLPDSWQGKVDLIVSNPPYVAASEWESLPRDVRDHEPYGALVAGPLGTEVLAEIGVRVLAWLRPGGYVICEIGENQGEQCLEIFAALAPRIVKDFAGRDRYVVGCAPQLRDLH